MNTIKDMREKRGIAIKDACVIFNVSRPTIEKWENGTRMPKLSNYEIEDRYVIFEHLKESTKNDFLDGIITWEQIEGDEKEGIVKKLVMWHQEEIICNAMDLKDPDISKEYYRVRDNVPVSVWNRLSVYDLADLIEEIIRLNLWIQAEPFCTMKTVPATGTA